MLLLLLLLPPPVHQVWVMHSGQVSREQVVTSVSSPWQAWPPWAAAVQARARHWVPSPQVTLQGLHSPHSIHTPSTGGGVE